ncbi:12347_t:CDS:2, partial [Cetraspora pellucida]
ITEHSYLTSVIMLTKKQVILSAVQKHEICKEKKMNPIVKNIDLANKYSPKLEEALGLWVDNALNSSQDIDGHILKKKAKFLRNIFLLIIFTNLMCAFLKEIEKNQLVLQQLLQPYDSEDI